MTVEDEDGEVVMPPPRGDDRLISAMEGILTRNVGESK